MTSKKRYQTILAPIELHCPECFTWTQHYRVIRNGAEVCTCQKCGHVQTYRAREAVR